MSVVLDEVIADTLSNAIAVAGRWVLTVLNSPHYRQKKHDVEIAEWFDTYKLSLSAVSSVELPSGMNEEEVQLVVKANEVQAALLELLCSRITSAPEVDIVNVRQNFISAITSRIQADESIQLAESLFNCYDMAVCDFAGRLAGAQESIFERLRNEAFSVRIVAVLNAINQHVQSINGRASFTEETAYITNYRRHVKDYHGKIQPPDSERRQRIPIDELYVPPRIVRVSDSGSQQQLSRLPEKDQTPAPSSLNNYLSIVDLSAQLDRTVLLGDPGGGKSTASNVLMHAYAVDDNGRIPFLVTLRDFASDNANTSIVGYIERKLDGLYQCAPPTGLMRQLFLSGRALVIFDGLDELTDTARRLEITDVVEQFCTEYPLTKVLVTSRVVGYSEAELDSSQFICYRLMGFSKEQTADYVRKWFSQDISVGATEISRWTQDFMNDSASVPDLRSNPLMLSLMCILYHGEGSIPRNRPEVYEKCAELLFRKWDARRKINIELRAQNLIEPVIRHLAYFMYTRDVVQSEVTEHELIRETTLFLRSRGFESEDDAIEAARQFVDFCRGRAWVFSDAGTTAAGERIYTFTHRTFLEYFTAAHLALSCDTPEHLARRLLPHVAKQEWDVVAELAIQKKDQTANRGAERAIDAMLNERRQRSNRGKSNVLRFLSRCITYAEVPPKQIRLLTRKTLEYLTQGDPSLELIYLPLADLIGLPMSDERRGIIRDEILSWVSDGLTGKGNINNRILGLTVAIHLDTGAFSLKGSDISPDALSYWSEVVVANRATFRGEIVSLSGQSFSMLRTALEEEFLDVATFLGQTGGMATALFQEGPVGIFSSRWIGYLQWTLSAAAEGSRTDRRLRTLRNVGKYLMENEISFPWADKEALLDVDSNSFEVTNRAASIDADQAASLGAIAIGCTMLELEIINHDDLPKIWQYLPKLMPYWNQRNTGIRSKLPSLQIEHRYQILLSKWAAGEVNFVAPHHH